MTSLVSSHLSFRAVRTDVVQRIMRRQNYMIALVNQGIVSFSIRLPFLGLCSFWSKTLEWWYFHPPSPTLRMDPFVTRRSNDANLAL